jgi:predicted O-methyltransferase YrrM
LSFKSINHLVRSDVAAAVLCKYLCDRAGKAWRRVYADAKHDKRADDARSVFEKRAEHGLFSNTWFDGSIDLWVNLLEPLKSSGRPAELLEVGCWEGRSSVFLVSYLPHARLTAVDTWEGGTEHREMDDVATIEQKFDHNLSPFRDRLVKRKGLSSVVLADLAVQKKECFDFIFVDGSHFADDVMIDAVLAWRLLREGGIAVFDDYLWHLAQYGWKKNPAPALNLFLRLIRGDYALMHVGHQLAIRKTASMQRYLS